MVIIVKYTYIRNGSVTSCKINIKMALDSRREAIIQICKTLMENEDISLTVKESALGAGILGLGAVLGGLLGGKEGLLVGGALGGAAAMMMTSDFKSIPQIISEMDSHQRKKLADRVGYLLKGVDVTQVATAVTVILSQEQLKSAVVKEIGNYIKEELS